MSTSHSDPIGFVGVGNMGAAMAERVLHVGGAVIVADASPVARQRLADAGARVAEDAAAVAASCRIVSVVVNTDDQVREAVLGEHGVLAAAPPGTIVAIHSTIHLDTLEEVAAAGSERSVTVIDAAVTGGVEAAQRGELAVLAGGPRAAVDAVRPALERYASLVVHAGDLGAGMAAKIALMVVSFGKLAAQYEGLRLAHAAGIDLAAFARVVSHTEAQSGIHEFFIRERAERFAPSYDGPLLAIARHEAPKSMKDLHAAMELAPRLGITFPFAGELHDRMPAVWGLEPPAP